MPISEVSCDPACVMFFPYRTIEIKKYRNIEIQNKNMIWRDHVLKYGPKSATRVTKFKTWSRRIMFLFCISIFLYFYISIFLYFYISITEKRYTRGVTTDLISGLWYTTTFDAITAEVEVGLKFMYILCLEANIKRPFMSAQSWRYVYLPLDSRESIIC